MHIPHIMNGDVTITMLKVIIMTLVIIKGIEHFVNTTLLLLNTTSTTTTSEVSYQPPIIFKKFL